jgi:predicted deacylase
MSIRKYCIIILFISSVLYAQTTRPERTNYEETSRYQDVIDFVTTVTNSSRHLKLDWLGYSPQGKRLPMIFYGDISDTRPETIRKSGKLVVYIQGNIHAGEVEGKEAMLELLRDLAGGKHKEWRRNLVLIIVPIFNADGNDNISLYNRPWQHGPVAGMGQRANGQGLDLNRDHMKLESPEVRAFVRVLNDYDPYITVDLHTTNGSFHGYHITYSYALNPVIDTTLDRFTRQVFFPDVEQRMRSQRWRVHRYGDYLEKTSAGTSGYYYWAHEPRYNSNYVGFRNRLAILSEAYSYIIFEQRIASTKALVKNILDVASAKAQEIKQTVQLADKSARRLRQFDSLGVRAEIVESNPAQEILLAEARELRNPYSGEKMYLMDEKKLSTVVTAEFYGTRATRKVQVPLRYSIPDSLTAVVRLLRDHGIVVDSVSASSSAVVQRFRITQNKQSEREYQKHRMRTLEGVYESSDQTVPAGTYSVNMDQPLSRLVLYLLEPESEDGVVAWNFMDRYYGDGSYYPIVKIIE